MFSYCRSEHNDNKVTFHYYSIVIAYMYIFFSQCLEMEVGLLIISCWVISFLASPSFGQRCSCKKELTTIGSQVSEVNKNGKSIQKSIEKLQRLHDKLTSKINTTLKQGGVYCLLVFDFIPK